MDPMYQYILRIADNCLILGHRMSEWCGHGPVLEQDIAMTNIALDLVGQARILYDYAAQVEAKGRSEDDIAYLRDALEYYNLLLVELPKGDFAFTVGRQFFYSAFQMPFLEQLSKCPDETLAAFAEKAMKETAYHLRWSGEWVVRLGDGTEESAQKMQKALEDLWPYIGESFLGDELDQWAAAKLGIDLSGVKTAFDARVDAVLAEAKLHQPDNDFVQKGGKQGYHSEHLGYILAEMQYLQRAYPGATW